MLDPDYIPSVTDGSYPVRAGNAVTPLIDGHDAFGRICEAVAAARASVWVTIAFHERGFRMPAPHGSFFDVLDRARARGLDVRVLFWRSPELDDSDPGTHFSGTDEQRRWLDARGSRFLARWDRLPSPLCHHQKSWLIDAGAPTEIAFVGGINLDDASVAVPGHPSRATGNIHDVYLELRGPAATDVNHNFVQRWNQASERDRADGAWPNPLTADDLAFPIALSPAAGEVPVQIARTVRAGCYTDSTPAPGATRFDIAAGERGILAQYLAAIAAARRSIYIEDQLIASAEVVLHLYGALDRGVEVVFLVPGQAHPEFVEARTSGAYAREFMALDYLRERQNFTLAGIASNNPPDQTDAAPTAVAGTAPAADGDRYHDVYVHAKVMLVDDAWATIGSANVASRSFFDDTEMNASIWHPETVRGLRCALLGEHLGRDAEDIAALDDRAALRLFRQVAQENRARREVGAPLEGLAFAIDPARYGFQ
ncbi:phospholipase D-like domain-containing protein [Haliangium sp.]|uniref:phospholipase D-like domain-containing protein n=1 Tax=Haliangium sp. TaxID=2663208 RepID=UPI003D1082E4